MTERRALIVSLDDVAALRSRGPGTQPDPVAAATLARLGGASGVSLHLQEDRPPSEARDARVLREVIERGLGLEISPVPQLVRMALELRADSVTLVDFTPADRGPDRAIDVSRHQGGLDEILRALDEAKLGTSLCIRPDLDQVKSAHRVGVRSIRLHTGRYARETENRPKELRRIVDAAHLAYKLGMQVGLGGALDFDNVAALLDIEQISFLCVGHAIAARATLVGMERAVSEMVRLIG